MAFSPALAQKLEDALGSAQRVDQLSKRTELFAKGGISAQNYWSTLKDVSSLPLLVSSSSGLSLVQFTRDGLLCVTIYKNQKLIN